MSTFELIDELEAGELAVAFEGEEPQALLEWGIERFSNIAISTSFQADSVALIDMAYEIDPEIKVFSVDTGQAPGRDARPRRPAAPAVSEAQPRADPALRTTRSPR